MIMNPVLLGLIFYWRNQKKINNKDKIKYYKLKQGKMKMMENN
jgi:hypothetical protein